MADILKFYSSFHFDLQCMCSYPHIILHPPANFRCDRKNSGGLLTSYQFFKMAAGSHIGLDLDNIRPPTKCSCWSEVGPQFWS